MKPQHLLYEKMLRHCCREDPLGVNQRDVCYEYEKVLCGGQESFVVLDGFIIQLEL